MCIATKIAELEEKIVKLKRLQVGTLPVKSALAALLEDYATEASEELPDVWQEILAIGSQYNLAVQVQPLAADELRQWQSANAENKKLKAELEELKRKLENSSASWLAKYPKLYNSQNSSECTDSVSNILNSRGFYVDVNLAGVYDPKDKQDSYSGWDIYCSVHDSGQVMSIGLSNEKLGQFWDVDTEFLADHNPNFPKSLSEKQPILAWVRSLIDLLPTPGDLIEVPGQQVLPLKFPDSSLTGDVSPSFDSGAVEKFQQWAEQVSENHKNLSNLCDAVAEPNDNNDDIEEDSEKKAPDLIEEFLITNLPIPHREMRARVTPALGSGKFAGATFTFYRGTEELFTTTQTADEIARGKNNPELIAVALAESWSKRQELKNLSPAGTTHTEPPVKDEFTELVYLSDAVAYLKRKDTGEILTGYLGFSNKTAEGDRAPTMAKSRAARWQEHLVGVYQLACSGSRECQRIESKNPKQPFKYELKLVKPSMGQLQGLATENFGLYPNEVAPEVEEKPSQSQISTETTETPGLSDFDLIRVSDFDELNPEFSVKYKGVELTNIWSSLRAMHGMGQQAHRLWRHGLLKAGEEIELKDCEAAVLHALQRTRGLA